MKGSELFDHWAPVSGPWTPWAKPTLFASVSYLAAPNSLPPPPTVPEPIRHALTPDTAVVLDLPGGDSVRWAAALAALGFQPVPLFNGTTGPLAVIAQGPVLEALRAEGPRLPPLPVAAPPVFMLDSRRMAVTRPKTPGEFDNRWMTFPQDFPSARVLKEHAIARAVVVSHAIPVQDDLTHVLLRWRRGGIPVFQTRPRDNARLEEAALREPRWFGYAFQRLLASLGLRRHAGGGFGSAVPNPSGGSSGYRGYG